MNCNDINQLVLTDYIDGELAPAKIKMIDAHIDDCAACRSQVEAVRQQSDLLAQAQNIGVPHELVWNRIKIGIREQRVVSPAPVFGFPAWRPVFAVSIFLMLITAGIVYRNGLSHQPYLTYVMGTESADDITDGIEQYFL